MAGAEIDELRAELARLRQVHAALVADHGALKAAHARAQPFESLGRLAGGVAHDFNNLLTVITNCTTLALADVGADARRDLEQTLLAAERAAVLTSQLAVFARKQVAAPRTTNLNAILKRSSGLLRRLLGEDIELVSTADPDLWEVHVDPGQFERLLVTLAANAREGLPQGGRLTFETKNLPCSADGLTELPAGLRGELVLLTIQHAGDALVETTPAQIGISMLRGVVEDQGGELRFHSDARRGTTCQIYLPRSTASANAAAAPEAPPRGGTETILLVEDDPLIRRLATRVLEGLGYTVLQAENGLFALEVVHNHTGEIELLLSDVVMPRMSGKVLAERLLAVLPTLKVLYVSGYTDDAVLHRGVLDRGFAFLQKPYTPNSLARKVRDVLDSVPSV